MKRESSPSENLPPLPHVPPCLLNLRNFTMPPNLGFAQSEIRPSHNASGGSEKKRLSPEHRIKPEPPKAKRQRRDTKPRFIHAIHASVRYNKKNVDNQGNVPANRYSNCIVVVFFFLTEASNKLKRLCPLHGMHPVAEEQTDVTMDDDYLPSCVCMGDEAKALDREDWTPVQVNGLRSVVTREYNFLTTVCVKVSSSEGQQKLSKRLQFKHVACETFNRNLQPTVLPLLSPP